MLLDNNISENNLGEENESSSVFDGEKSQERDYVKVKIDDILNPVDNLSKIKDVIRLDNNGVLKIISNDIFEKISANNIEKAILEVINELEIVKGIKVKTIDISSLSNVDNQYLKGKLFNIIGKNFPLLEVARLEEGLKVIDITFLGIKSLNDNISKEFVDLFNGKLKEYFQINFNESTFGDKKHGRIIRNNYKHMTFSMDKKVDISKSIFGGKSDKKKLLKDIFDDLIKNSNIELTIALKDSKLKDIDKIRELLIQKFDFGIGTSVVKNTSNNGIISQKDKLKAFYEAEIASRNKVDLVSLGDNIEFKFENILNLSKSAIAKEGEIVREFKGKKFDFNGTNFDIIVDGKINNTLLRYVRKGEDIKNNILKLKVEKYIDNLTSGFDFIAPFIEKSQLLDIPNIEEQIKKGIIDVNLLQNTYKNTLSLEALKIGSKGKKGLRIFIDIVDMGIMNLIDFRTLALDISSGKININNIDELLDAGKTATNKFQNLVSLIKIKYKDVQISLGGDEIFLFLPGKTEAESNSILQDISKKLDNQDLVGRISNSIDNYNDKIFDNLDGFLGINKILERKVEKIINNNKDTDIYNIRYIYNKLGNLKLSSISLNIDYLIQYFISGNISDVLKDIEKNINDNYIKDILTGKIKEYSFNVKVIKRDKNGIEGEKIGEINVSIQRGNDKELTISIK